MRNCFFARIKQGRQSGFQVGLKHLVDDAARGVHAFQEQHCRVVIVVRRSGIFERFGCLSLVFRDICRDAWRRRQLLLFHLGKMLG